MQPLVLNVWNGRPVIILVQYDREFYLLENIFLNELHYR